LTQKKVSVRNEQKICHTQRSKKWEQTPKRFPFGPSATQGYYTEKVKGVSSEWKTKGTGTKRGRDGLGSLGRRELTAKGSANGREKGNFSVD